MYIMYMYDYSVESHFIRYYDDYAQASTDYDSYLKSEGIIDDLAEEDPEKCFALLKVSRGVNFTPDEIEVEGKYEVLNYHEGGEASLHIKQI